MNTSDREKRTTSASQRPTLEVVDDDSLEFSTLPPSEAPSAPGFDRSTIPGAARTSWCVLTPGATLPVAFELRLLLGVLRALTPIHTNLLIPPHERVYGRVCRENVRVDPDGMVRLCPRDEAVEPSGELRAPEEFGQGTIDQQADLYAVGALVLAAVERGRSEGNTWMDSVRSIATRAVRLDRRARWASAGEFATQLEAAVGAQLPSQQALCLVLRSKSGIATGDGEVTEFIPRAELDGVRGRPSVRPSIVSLADSDLQVDDSIELTADRYEPIDCKDDPAPFPAALDSDEEPAPFSFDGARLATSTIPEGARAPTKTSWKKLWWTAGFVVAALAAASVVSLSTLRKPAPDGQYPSLSNEVTSVQPKGSLAVEPAADPHVSQMPASQSASPPSPRPTVTASFPPVPVGTAKSELAPRTAKPKASPPRSSTYDPEGI